MHHEVISPPSLIPGRLKYFNWVRGFNNKDSEKNDRDSMLPAGAPLCYPSGLNMKSWKGRGWSGYPAVRGPFRGQISGFWYVLWNWQERMQTQLTDQSGSKAPRQLSRYSNQIEARRDTAKIPPKEQKKPFTLGIKGISSEPLFAPVSFDRSPNWIPDAAEASRDIISAWHSQRLPQVFRQHRYKARTSVKTAFKPRVKEGR